MTRDEEQMRTHFYNAIKLAKTTEAIVSKKSLDFQLEGLGRVMYYALMRLMRDGLLTERYTMSTARGEYLEPVGGQVRLKQKLYQKQQNEGLFDLYWSIRNAVTQREEGRAEDPHPERLAEVMGILTQYVSHYTTMVRLMDMLLSISKHIGAHGSSDSIAFPRTNISPAAMVSSRNPNGAASELERYYEQRGGQKLGYYTQMLGKDLEDLEQSTRATYTLVERYKARAAASPKKAMAARRY